MQTYNNKKLYDMSVRAQVYTEDVKLWQINSFNPVLKEIADNFKSVLSNVKYETLDQLTKAELNRLIAKLKISQADIYNVYYKKLLIDLQNFMYSSLKVTQIYVGSFLYSAKKQSENIKKVSQKTAIAELMERSKENTAIFGIASITRDDELLWSKILNEPLPVNGIYLLAFIQAFIQKSKLDLENLIRMAYANKWTLQQLINEATSFNDVQGSSSQVKKISVAHAAVVATVMQHIAQISNAAVMSLAFGFYEWISVIDGSTTEICRKRNRKRYKFGKGPLPPAHMWCRSGIAAIVGTDDIDEETFYTWIRRQNEIFQNDVLGAANARKLREGLLNSKDISKYESNMPLSLKDFENKIDIILM